MKAIVHNESAVVVTLSKKNLRDLVAQAIEGRDTICLRRSTENGFVVYVYVEDDDLHYEGRESGPGSGLVS